MWGVLDLPGFANSLVQRRVIGHLKHDGTDTRAEVCFEFIAIRIGVFNGVVQECGLQNVEVGHASNLGKNCRNFDWVMYIRNLSFAFTHLPFVLPGGKTCRTAKDRLV